MIDKIKEEYWPIQDNSNDWQSFWSVSYSPAPLPVYKMTKEERRLERKRNNKTYAQESFVKKMKMEKRKFR